MLDSVVSGNSTAGDNAHGGGIWFGDDAQIDNSVISGNATTGNFADGGGLTGYGTLVVENSSVVGNSTSGAGAEGGGMRLSTTSQIINSTISGNSTAAVDAPGGGVFVLGTNLSVINSTITENTSQAGAGGVESRAQEDLTYFVQVQSSIIAGNAGPNGNFRSVPGSGTILVDMSDSLFGDGQAEVTGTSVDNVFSNSPGLGALGDNGCGAPPGGVRRLLRAHASAGYRKSGHRPRIESAGARLRPARRGLSANACGRDRYRRARGQRAAESAGAG